MKNFKIALLTLFILLSNSVFVSADTLKLPFSAPKNYPLAGFTPYSANSPFNQMIPNNPVVNSNTPNFDNFYSSFGMPVISFGLLNKKNQYGHPIYFSKKTDPKYKIHCLEDWNVCPNLTIHIPSYAQPAQGSDHHIAIIDQSFSPVIEIDCWNANNLSGKGGTLTASECNYDPAGLSNQDGLNYGQTGAGFALWAGVIRQQELVARNIPHALFLIAPCTNDNIPVYPSVWRGSTDTLCDGDQGAAYGALSRLNLTPDQIESFPISDDEKTIDIAWSQYGAFIGDTNNNSGFGFAIEADDMYTNAGYKNSQCPRNGSPCTPATALMNSENNNYFVGGFGYTITLNAVNWTNVQWLAPSE